MLFVVLHLQPQQIHRMLKLTWHQKKKRLILILISKLEPERNHENIGFVEYNQNEFSRPALSFSCAHTRRHSSHLWSGCQSRDLMATCTGYCGPCDRTACHSSGPLSAPVPSPPSCHGSGEDPGKQQQQQKPIRERERERERERDSSCHRVVGKKR